MKRSKPLQATALLSVMATVVLVCWLPGRQNQVTCRIKVDGENLPIPATQGAYDPCFIQANFFLPYQLKH